MKKNAFTIIELMVTVVILVVLVVCIGQVGGCRTGGWVLNSLGRIVK